MEELQGLRVKFLRKSLDESTFKSRLLQMEHAHQKASREANILQLTCRVINDLQHAWHYTESVSSEDIVSSLDEYIVSLEVSLVGLGLGSSKPSSLGPDSGPFLVYK